MTDAGRCKFKQGNQSQASERHRTLLNGLDWKLQQQQDEFIQHTAEAFHRVYSDVNHFVTINTFIRNCNLITHFFFVIELITVTLIL